MRSSLAGMDMWKRRFFILLAFASAIITAGLLLLVVFDVGDTGREAPLVAEQANERRADDRSSTTSYAEFEGEVLSIDRPSNTLRLRVVEAEYGQGAGHPTEVVVELPPTFELGERLRLGSYIEVDGVYVPGENVLYVSEIDFEGDDRRTSEGRTVEYGEAEEQVQQQAEQVYEDYDEQEEWAQQQAEQVYEDHEEQEQQQAEQVYEDYDEQEEWAQQQAEQVYEDYEGQEQQQAEQVYEDYDEEERREVEDDSGQYEAYDGSSGDREDGPISSYAELEGRVVAVDVGDRSFRLRVLEAEHARGIRIPTEVTVELRESWTVPGWIRVGRYVEVEGRFVVEENVLYASEIELEDD